MPYHWSDTPKGPLVLDITAHRSLPKRGFAAVILFAFFMMCIPLIGLIGSVQFWWMLPPLGIALWAIWEALQRSYRDGEVREDLTRQGEVLTLTHHPARGKALTWACNIYWIKAELHKQGGPVANYVTLAGNGRRVEIGSFLSEDERVALFQDLNAYLREEAKPEPA